jgi:hypothetical protein
VSELHDYERVVADLERCREIVTLGPGRSPLEEAYADALRLLRAMREDFEKYADHGLDERGRTCSKVAPGATIKRPCNCGLAAARERLGLR